MGNLLCWGEPYADILCVVCEKKGYIYLIEQSISPMDFFSFIFIYFFYLKLHPALG